MIHPTAIVSPKAKLGVNVKVGPFAIIDDDVVIGDNCEISARTHIQHAELGSGNYIGEGTLIGCAPQDLKYKNEPTMVIIGDNNMIREYTTIHRSTHVGDATRIGNSCFIMSYDHIAHDCKIGNKVIMINSVAMSGHCTVDDCAVISGDVMIHQFVRIGGYVMLGGGSKITKDVPPFVMLDGNPAQLHGLNKLGLKRNGFSAERIKIIEDMFLILFRDKSMLFADAQKKVREALPQNDDVKYMLEFVANSKRGIER
ncbi:MAG: acyl-ACP--UDP-N-acetylglucosamine O-acyltransferase [Spirochaetia bacterium]|nr:acyl-ACP--UDP-N-acetylglucosamine O-acyltransferase [Spirochaetia bacterium]